MTPDTLNKIYDILVEEAGAPEYKRAEFCKVFPKQSFFIKRGGLDLEDFAEWIVRFISTGNTVLVSEDETPERQAIITKTNARLAELELV